MITISEDSIKDSIFKGLEKEVSQILANKFAAGHELETLVRQVINQNRAGISFAVDKALKEALASDDFMGIVRAQMLNALTGDFVHAFDGVASAAGRKAAQDIGAKGFVERLATG